MATKKTKSIQIDCTVANYIAEKMADDTFGEEYKEALAARTKALEEFIISYLPEHMLDNPDSFYARTKSVGIRIENADKSWSNIYGDVSFFMPAPSQFEIHCSVEDCKDLIEADRQYSIISKKKSRFSYHVENVLLSLKTEEEIKKKFPEAIKYMVSKEELEIARIREEMESKNVTII